MAGNRQFVQIPHARFIHLLTEESYTSKCSFLDNEPIGKHEGYAGKRWSADQCRCERLSEHPEKSSPERFR